MSDKDYQAKCRSVESVIAQIKEIFADPEFMVERFDIGCVTKTGGTLRLRFDKKDVK